MRWLMKAKEDEMEKLTKTAEKVLRSVGYRALDTEGNWKPVPEGYTVQRQRRVNRPMHDRGDAVGDLTRLGYVAWESDVPEDEKAEAIKERDANIRTAADMLATWRAETSEVERKSLWIGALDCLQEARSKHAGAHSMVAVLTEKGRGFIVERGLYSKV